MILAMHIIVYPGKEGGDKVVRISSLHVAAGHLYQLLIKMICPMEQEVNSKKDVLLDYTFVLDASGSMRAEIPEVLEELNRQIRELKLKFEETLRPCRITIVKFDTVYVVLRDSESVEELAEITREEYFSEGMTALYDAIGLAVKRTDARVDFQVRRGEAEALVVIFTDGGENASSEFTGPDIQKILGDYQERVGWEIALIGTDVSAIMDMGRRNMRRDKMRHYNQNQKVEAMYSLGQSVSEYYTTKDSSLNLNKKELWMREQLRREEEQERQKK
jgi:uncharacterized protein YegL